MASGTAGITSQLRRVVSTEPIDRDKNLKGPGREKKRSLSIRLDNGKTELHTECDVPCLKLCSLNTMKGSSCASISHTAQWCFLIHDPTMHSDNADGPLLVFPEGPFNPSHNMRLRCSGTVLQCCNGLCNGNVFGQMGEASADVLNYAFYS